MCQPYIESATALSDTFSNWRDQKSEILRQDSEVFVKHWSTKVFTKASTAGSSFIIMNFYLAI